MFQAVVLPPELAKLRQNVHSQADLDTHLAFAMNFSKNLIILHDTKQQLVQYQVSSEGPLGNIASSADCFAVALTQDGFQILIQ